MEVKLVVTRGKHAGLVVPVSARQFFIGRAPDCHLWSPNGLIRRYHCAILIGENYVAVRPFARNAETSVNGESVKGRRQLEDGGAIVRWGGSRLRLHSLEFEHGGRGCRPRLGRRDSIRRPVQQGDLGEAAIHAAEATRYGLENSKRWVETYFATRQLNRDMRGRWRRPPASREKLFRLARLERPERLSAAPDHSPLRTGMAPAFA